MCTSFLEQTKSSGDLVGATRPDADQTALLLLGRLLLGGLLSFLRCHGFVTSFHRKQMYVFEIFASMIFFQMRLLFFAPA